MDATPITSRSPGTSGRLSVVPTPAFFRHELPSQVARVPWFPHGPQSVLATASRPSPDFLTTGFQAFPPGRRFPLAHLLATWPRHGLSAAVYSPYGGLPAELVLAPDVQLSLHRAPTSRFLWLGEPKAWELALPAALRGERNEWLCGGGRPRCPHVGGGIQGDRQPQGAFAGHSFRRCTGSCVQRGDIKNHLHLM